MIDRGFGWGAGEVIKLLFPVALNLFAGDAVRGHQGLMGWPASQPASQPGEYSCEDSCGRGQIVHFLEAGLVGVRPVLLF